MTMTVNVTPWENFNSDTYVLSWDSMLIIKASYPPHSKVSGC